MRDSLSWIHVVVFWIAIFVGMELAYNRNEDEPNGIDFIVCAGLICVAGLRKNYIDTRTYRSIFNQLDPLRVFSTEFLTDEQSKDKGFTLLTAFIKMITKNSQVYLFILSAITIGLLFAAIVKWVPDRRIGIFLLIMTGCYLDSMNGIRQALVTAILFYFLPGLVDQKKIVQYILLVLLVSTMHGSALVLLPLYFWVDKEPWSEYTIILIGGVILIFVFFNLGFGKALAIFLEETQYGNEYTKELTQGSSGTSFMRFPVAIAPLILGFINRKEERDYPYYNIMFNMSLINATCWFISLKSLYFYRLATYFLPFMIVHLCYEIDRANRRREDQQIQVAAIVLYFIFHLYSVYVMSYYLFIGYLNI